MSGNSINGASSESRGASWDLQRRKSNNRDVFSCRSAVSSLKDPKVNKLVSAVWSDNGGGVVWGVWVKRILSLNVDSSSFGVPVQSNVSSEGQREDRGDNRHFNVGCDNLRELWLG